MGKTMMDDCFFTDEEFAEWGMDAIAYVKKGFVNNLPVWTIHSSQGIQVGYATERELAAALARRNNLQPVSVH